MLSMTSLRRLAPVTTRLQDLSHLGAAMHKLEEQPPITILGAGYTGQHLYQVLYQHGYSVLATSRSPDTQLLDVPHQQRVRFDLLEPETWQGIPHGSTVFWCFPAKPLDAVKAFVERMPRWFSRLIVLGSTSAYDPPAWTPPMAEAPLIDERAPVNQALERVQGEEHLREHHGAIILRIAGIYGQGRNVLNWIRRGRVTSSERYVNLIHVDDLVGICLAALERGRPGAVYNVSDGTPRRWSEICHEAHRRWGISIPPPRPETRLGKRISIARLTNELRYELRHPDLYTALEEIEAAQRRSPKLDG